MANYTQIDKLIEIADNRSVRTILMSSVSAITLAGCMGGGGGGTFGVFGGGSGGNARLMGGQLVKGTVVGARVFQDVDGDGEFDSDGTENFAFTDNSGAYSLSLNNLTSAVTVDSNRPGIDITTGAAPGKIIINPVNQSGLVSTPLSFLGDEYGSTNVDSVLTNMPAGIDVSTYDPIDEIKSAEGDSTSPQYQIAEQVDALAAQTQVIINSIEKMLSSDTVASTDPLGEAKQSIIDGYTAKGSALDLGSNSDVETILNSSPLASVPGFENIISSLATAISSVNTQIWTTQNTGDLFGDGRSIMLVAQDNLNSSLDELALSPSDAVAGQIAGAYSGANLTSLETAATDSLPTFNPATGVGANVLPSIDKATVTLGDPAGVTVNVLSNDIALDGSELTITAISATNVKDGSGLSPLMAALDSTTSVNPINSATTNVSGNLATLNSDGTITFAPDAVGRYTIYYQVYDGSNPAVGSLVIDSLPEAPTISLSQSSITLDELKDGNAGSSTSTSTLSLDFSNIITISDSGGTVLLSYRILDDDAVYKGLANEQGDTSQNTKGINTSTITPDAYNSINLASNDLSNLEFTFDRDYSGSFYIEFQVVETLNNRFVSSSTALEDRRILVTINPISDTPTLSVANVSGVEDDAFIPLTISSATTDQSETVTIYVEKPSEVVKFINTTTNAEVGESATFDFVSGSIVDGAPNAVALTIDELTNLGMVTDGDAKSDFTIKVMASSLDSGTATATKSSLSTITVSMEAKADPVGIEVNNSSSSSILPNSDENSIISIPITLNLNDPTENITLSIGNFRDASGNLLSVDRSLETAFRPVSFTRNNETTDFENVDLISLSNNFFTFSSLTMSDLVTDALSGNQQFTVNFLPITNFNGLITFDVYATSIEPTAVTSSNASNQTDVITLTQTLDPVSQTPGVSLTDVSVVEFTNDSAIDDVTTHKTDLSNITVSLSDTSNLTEVTIVLSAADSVTGNDPGYTLDASGVTSFVSSSYDFTVSTTSPLTIKVAGTKADGSSLGADLVADMTLLLSEVKLVPPEDYSGTSTITTSVTSKEAGAEESQPTTDSFDITVSAVAETPTVTGSAPDTNLEDTDIQLDLNVTINDNDVSETVSQVRISGLTSIGEQNLTGILVDGNGNLVGSNDGSGTTILTSAEYNAAKDGTAPIFFRPPADYSGDVSLDIVAVVQEPNGSTATSDPSNINPFKLTFSLTAVSEEASASSNDVSVVEFTNDSAIDDDTTHKTDLSNITVSLSDTSNLSEVTIVLSAADSVTGNDEGFTLDASGVTSFDSSYNFTVSTTSPLTIKVAGTVADGSSLGADLVADMTLLLSEVKLKPPEDYSGTSTITTSVTSKEAGAEESQPTTDSFDITVSAVAETPTVTGSAPDTNLEDTDIQLDVNVTINDNDVSETVSQVRISGLTSIGEQNLTGILVDGNGNLVGSNDGSGTTILTSAEYNAAKDGAAPIFFRPPADYSGDVSLDIVAVVQEPNGSTATSDTSTFSFTLDPVSETPDVSSNDVSVVEFTNDINIDDDTTHKTDLSNITVSLSDTSNLSEVTIVLSAADSVTGNDPGYTLDASGVTSFASSYNFTVSTTSPLTIKVAGTVADGSSLGADLVADMTLLLSEVKLKPPEDYSGTSTITTSVTSKEVGAEESQPTTDSFDITVSAVAETPTVNILSSLGGDEDDHTSLKIDSSIISANSGDPSETISSYQISGLSVGGVNYSLVDVSGNAVGSSDGSGTTTITAAQFTSGVYLKSPADFHGAVILSVVAVSKDGVSSTAPSSSQSFTVNISPIADAPTLSVPDTSTTAIDIVENDRTNYSTSAINGISLNSNVVKNNDDEDLKIYVAFEKGANGSSEVTVDVSGVQQQALLINDEEFPQDDATIAELARLSNYDVNLNNYSLYLLGSEDDLSNLTFYPPEAHVESSYEVRVIATSKDTDTNLGTSYSSVSENITYNILEVAKSPIVTLNDADIDTTSVNAITDLTKTSELNLNLIEIPLEIRPQGLDTVTVLITGLPSDDFVFKDSVGGNIVGARNSTGTVYVFNLDDGFEVDDGGNFSLYVDPTFDASQNGSIPNTGTQDDGTGTGNLIPEFNYPLNLSVTAFAIDGSGAGTTASTVFNLGGTITSNVASGDPLIIDFGNDNELNDNFSVSSRDFDLNSDGLNEKVFLPDSDIGIMFYASSDSASSSFLEIGEALSMEHNIFSEQFTYNGLTSGTSLGALRLLDSNSTNSDGSPDGVIDENDAEFERIGYWRDGLVGTLDGLVVNESLESRGDFTIDGVLSVDASTNLNATVNISSTSDNSSVNFTITGKDLNGEDQTEIITGVNKNTVEGTKSFKTITQISSDAAASNINIGVPPNGSVNSGEYFFLSSADSVNLNNFTFSNTVIDGSSSSQVEGYISREGNISIGGNDYDTYEVALGLEVAEAGSQFTADTISFSDNSLQLSEGLSEGSLGLSLTSGDAETVYPSATTIVTLVTLSGIPDAVILSQGVKQANGDWLLLGSQIAPEEPISFIAADTDYAGNFIVSGWATTTVIDGPEDTYTSTSASQTMTVQVQPVIDDAIFEAFDSTGFEDGGRDISGAVIQDNVTKSQISDAGTDGPIPVVIRYGVGDKDGSETATIILEIDSSHVGTGESGLKFVYHDGSAFKHISNDQLAISTADGITSFTFSNINSANDPIIKGLHLIPKANHVPTDGIDITAIIKVSDTGSVFVEKARKDFIVNIIDRADVFPVTFNGNLERKAENVASDTGVDLIKTVDGVYQDINSEGNPVNTSDFDGWIIGIQRPVGESEFDKSYNEIMLQVGTELFNAKLSSDGSELVFNVPSSGLYVDELDENGAPVTDGDGDPIKVSHNIKLVTPEYFDKDLDLTFKTLSQGGAGDVAISDSIARSVQIDAVGDGVKELEVPDTIAGVEDGAAIRLSVKVAREDTSENITQVKLTGSYADFGIDRADPDDTTATSNVVYLTRVETRPLDKFTSDISSNLSGSTLTDAATLDLDQARTQSFDSLTVGSLSLTLKIAGRYGQDIPDFVKETDDSGELKYPDLESLKLKLETDFAGQYALLLRESNPTGDIFYGLKWNGLNLVPDNLPQPEDEDYNSSEAETIETAGDWAKKEFMENDFGSNVTRSVNGDNVEYVINIQDQAKALVGDPDQYQQAEVFLARNIGVKTSPNVNGVVELTYAVATTDTDPDTKIAASSEEKDEKITLNISGRADKFDVEFTSDIKSTAEDIASTTGVDLIKTVDGVYQDINSEGNPVNTSDFDGWIIGIQRPVGESEFDKSYNEIMLQVGTELFNAKLSSDGSELVFNVPSSGLYVDELDENGAPVTDGDGDPIKVSHNIKLVTPEYFDKDLDLTFKTLSQGGAGDVAISDSIARSVQIDAVGDGVKELEDPGNIVGVEDGAAIRLSVKVAREDASENITQVKLTGSYADFGIDRADPDDTTATSNVVYLIRDDEGIKEKFFHENYIRSELSVVDKLDENGNPMFDEDGNKKTDEIIEYFIDIKGQAKAIVDSNSELENTVANYQQTEDFLSRNIGIKTSPDVFGEVNLTFAVTTIDTDPDSGVSNTKTKSEELKINVTNINDLAFIDESTISSDSTYFENPGLDFQLHKDAVIKDKESSNFFNGFISIIISNIKGTALPTERIKFIETSPFSITEDLKLVHIKGDVEEVIGSIKINDSSGLIIEFNEYGTSTKLNDITELVKDLQFSAPDIIEDGTRKITLSLNDGGGPNEDGISETSITRTLNLFVGKSGTEEGDTINGSNNIEEALVGGLGEDTLVGGVRNFIDLQLEKDFFDLYSTSTRPDAYHNKVNLGIDNSDSSSDLASIKTALNNEYDQSDTFSLVFKEEDYDEETGKLIIDLNTIDGVNDPQAVEVLFVENIISENGDIYKSETLLEQEVIGNNVVSLSVLKKVEELFVGLHSDNTKYNKNLQDILDEKSNYDVKNVKSNIFSTLTSNLIIRNKTNLEDTFVSSGSMHLNDTQDIDTIDNIQNVKGSEDKDHIFGSNNNNTLEGRSGDDILYGGAGNDKILGGEGNDIISGGSGNDYIDGRSGDDLIFVSSGLNATKPQTVRIKNDEIPTGLSVVGKFFTQNNIEMSVYSGSDLTMFSGVDVLYNYIIRDTEDETADIVPVFYRGNDIYSEDWTDSIGQTIIGGEGYDTLSFDHINNGVLLDFVFGIGTLDEVDADGVIGSDGIGEVIYFVLEGQTYHTFEKIVGSKVNDYIVNLTPWDHFMEIFGGQGNDEIYGSYGNEILSGGFGNDTLSGGYGVDTLSGGEGFDKFIILDDTPTESFKKQWILNNPEDEERLNSDSLFKSDDIIKDFIIGVDTIDLTSLSSFNVDLSGDTDNNDLNIKTNENNFDAVMEIITSDVEVSITLENFGLNNPVHNSEEDLIASILV